MPGSGQVIALCRALGAELDPQGKHLNRRILPGVINAPCLSDRHSATEKKKPSLGQEEGCTSRWAGSLTANDNSIFGLP